MKFRSAADGKFLESNRSSCSTTQNVDSALPFGEEQIQTLVSIVYATVSDFENNNATFNLIKTLSSNQYFILSTDFYYKQENSDSKNDAIKTRKSIYIYIYYF